MFVDLYRTEPGFHIIHFAERQTFDGNSDELGEDSFAARLASVLSEEFGLDGGDIRPADKRYKTNIGWLDSRHSFSFGHHHYRSKHPPRPAVGEQRRHRQTGHGV